MYEVHVADESSHVVGEYYQIFFCVLCIINDLQLKLSVDNFRCVHSARWDKLLYSKLLLIVYACVCYICIHILATIPFDIIINSFLLTFIILPTHNNLFTSSSLTNTGGIGFLCNHVSDYQDDGSRV